MIFNTASVTSSGILHCLYRVSHCEVRCLYYDGGFLKNLFLALREPIQQNLQQNKSVERVKCNSFISRHSRVVVKICLKIEQRLNIIRWYDLKVEDNYLIIDAS